MRYIIHVYTRELDHINVMKIETYSECIYNHDAIVVSWSSVPFTRMAKLDTFDSS